MYISVHRKVGKVNINSFNTLKSPVKQVLFYTFTCGQEETAPEDKCLA